MAVTKNSTSLFVKGGDLTSLSPLCNGAYEEHVVDFIGRFSPEYSDWLIDIGAHIGLIACQVGDQFGHYELIEPNPISANVLRSNILLSISDATVEIHQVALGANDGELLLRVPKTNLGGAFIRAQNRYSLSALAKKDYFASFDEENYIKLDVSVVAAEKFLSDVFEKYMKKGWLTGMIKIDVEGYEDVVVAAILAKLPKNMRCVVLFENWDGEMDIEFIRNCRRVDNVFVLRRVETVARRFSYLGSRVASILRHEFVELSECTGLPNDGEIVFVMTPEPSS